MTTDEMTQPKTVPVEWWDGTEDDLSPKQAVLEVEPDDEDSNQVSIHTFHDGRGSLNSYTLDRESARRLALRLLIAAEV